MYFRKPLNKSFLGTFLFLGIIAVFFVSCADTEDTSKSPAVEVEEVSLPAAPGIQPLAPGDTFCIELDSFCDSMTLTQDASGNGNVYGLWDWTCGAIPPEEMLGALIGGEVLVGGLLQDIGLTETWRMDVAAKTVDIFLFANGGATPPSLLVSDGFTFSPGACPTAPTSDKPSVND